MNYTCEITGLGDSDYDLAICIGNRPPLAAYTQLNGISAMVPGEIASIASQTGNHWRKIFNVYAKLIAQLAHDGHRTWQGVDDWRQYRDQQLLQAGSNTALLFSGYPKGSSHDKDSSKGVRADAITIIAGKDYARQCGYDIEQLQPCAHEFPESFGWSVRERLIVAPYLDYRQLSDRKIAYLSRIISSMSAA